MLTSLRARPGKLDFKTTRPCFVTNYRHINLVAADTATWEQSAAFWLEAAVVNGNVQFYARNDQLGLIIPYEYLGTRMHYQPDFLVRLADGQTLILEIKGWETEEDRVKHEAARRWVDAVNTWGQMGRWVFHVCRDPQGLAAQLKHMSTNTLIGKAL